MIELTLLAGGDEDYAFRVLDNAGQPVADGVPVKLRVDGRGEFTCTPREPTDDDPGNRLLHLEPEDTAPFSTGVHHAQLLAFDDDDPRLVEHVIIVSTTLIEGD